MDSSSNELLELLAVLFVSHGSNGSHLLFKYPFSNQHRAPFKNSSSNLNLTQSFKRVFKRFSCRIHEGAKHTPYSIIPNEKDNVWIIEK